MRKQKKKKWPIRVFSKMCLPVSHESWPIVTRLSALGDSILNDCRQLSSSMMHKNRLESACQEKGKASLGNGSFTFGRCPLKCLFSHLFRFAIGQGSLIAYYQLKTDNSDWGRQNWKNCNPMTIAMCPSCMHSRRYCTKAGSIYNKKRSLTGNT